jgi:hypothetical protein
MRKPVQPRSKEHMKKISKFSRPKEIKVTHNNIAEAIGCSTSTVSHDAANGLFNSEKLKSIAYYIVGRTLLDVYSQDKG